MPQVSLYNIEGKEVGQIELNDQIFGIEMNQNAMHDVVVNYLANQRQGTQSTKTRGEVRGGGKKPWKQKGTGRARQGSTRSPQWIKGGVAMGPKPRKYTYTLNKKVKRLALKSALTSKVNDKNIIVIDELNIPEFKTKKMVEILNNLKIDTKAMIVVGQRNDNVRIAARNIPTVKTALVSTINVYDILKYEKLVITKEAVEKIEEVYA